MYTLICILISSSIAYSISQGDPNAPKNPQNPIKEDDSSSSFDEYVKSVADEFANSGINPTYQCDPFTYNKVMKWQKKQPPHKDLLHPPKELINYNGPDFDYSEVIQDPSSLECSNNFFSTTYENYFNFNSEINYLKGNNDFYFYLVQLTTLVTLAQCQYNKFIK